MSEDGVIIYCQNLSGVFVDSGAVFFFYPAVIGHRESTFKKLLLCSSSCHNKITLLPGNRILGDRS